MNTLRQLNDAPVSIAPDGLEVRILAASARGGMAHFRLGANSTGRAILHEGLDEIWFCLSGSADLWLSPDGNIDDDPVAVSSGVSFAVPEGVSFQLRNLSDTPVDFIGVTMPPWPGDQAVTLVDGPW